MNKPKNAKKMAKEDYENVGLDKKRSGSINDERLDKKRSGSINDEKIRIKK